MSVIRLLLTVLLLLPSLALAQTGVVSGASVTATGTTASRTLADRFAQVFNVKDYGAKGDCSTDDSISIAAAETAAMAVSKGSIPTVYFPAACYVLGAGATLPLLTHPVHLRGNGTHKTYLSVSTSYVGDIFSFSEIWQGASGYSNGMLPTSDNAGIMVTGLSIFGDKTSSNVNNAIIFYDRDNFAVVRDVEVFYLNGACISTGQLKNQSQGYVRESLFYNVRCNNAGTASRAAVDISSTTAAGGDATNELQFHGLNIYGSAGVGLAIRNPNNDVNATRLISFYGLRVEYSAGDNIDIGSSADAGQVAAVHIYDLESITPGQTNANKYAVNVDTAGPQLYDIMVMGGQLGPCWTATTCKGINVGNVRLAKFLLENNSVSGTSVTYQSTTGASVVLDGDGYEQNWTYSYPAGFPKTIQTPVYRYGDPSLASNAGNTPAVTLSYHDGSGSFGNAPGAGAADLQSVRNGATQVASAANSCLLAGSFNTASGLNSCATGGANNTVSGAFSFSGGGGNGTDRGRSVSQVFGGLDISTAGDVQASHFVLSATCASCASQQLTAAHAAASAVNIANISNAQAYAMSWRCVSHDITTAGTDNATAMPVMLMTRDANAASTAVALGTPATATRGTWTGGGFAFSADTTNGGVKIAFTSPTGNTDTFHAVCEGHDAETQ